MLTVVILTYNEICHIARALDSLAGLADEIVVIDSYSTDGTVELARARGCTVAQHPFVNQAKQFQWALDTVALSGDWIMRLDADEIVEADLAANLRRTLPQLPAEVTGVNLKRKTIFQDRWIRHGGRYPLMMLRLWRRGAARIEDRWMDEHIVLLWGRAVTIDGGFADHNLNDLTSFTDKHNKYASREAVEILAKRHGVPLGAAPEESAGELPRQVRVKRFFRDRLFLRLPLELSAVAYFLYRYVLRFGFLDGLPGFTYNALQCFWYRLLVAAKVREWHGKLAPLATVEEKSASLRSLCGLDL
jgi:glycosyltransferase involved in cell wall biosynthesis